MSTLKADGNVADWFGEKFRDLAEAYPQVKIRERQVRVYAAALQDLAPEQITRAMAQAILELKWFPSVAELRQYVGPSPDDRAIIAWAALRDAVETVGGYSSITVEDGHAAAALVRVTGSWAEFCDLDEGPALTLARQTFLALYRDVRRSGASAAPVRLAGRCEMQSGGQGVAGWTARLTLDGRVESIRLAQLPEGEPTNDPGSDPGALPVA